MIRRPLTTPEVAEVLGVSPSTVRTWRRRGQGPAYRQPAGKGSQPVYDPEVVELWKIRNPKRRKK
jgi:excisionase family DNA binding protein